MGLQTGTRLYDPQSHRTLYGTPLSSSSFHYAEVKALTLNPPSMVVRHLFQEVYKGKDQIEKGTLYTT